MRDYDVLVIGGGHAGAEAAWAAARLGARTALVTFRRAAIGRLSCNPSIGGIGKGQIVREIDALGGLMGLVADQAGIQFRMLNRRKGPALWAPRAQADCRRYPQILQRHLESCPNLDIIQAGAEAILPEPARAATGAGKRVVGVRLADGRRLPAAAVVLATGTFLRGLMHCGEAQTPGGRIGECAAVGLSSSLRELGLELGRFKTGTPPRVARASVDFSRLSEQQGDAEPAPFSFMTERLARPQVSCWITETNPAVHELIRANLHRAPLYSGQIRARGPRYCPSIEDKVVRFADKPGHQVFLEPEARASPRIYVNGISTSLPRDVQHRLVALIRGLERAEIVQWGYAVEYDFVRPAQIDASLMSKRIDGLFLAGQINGTSGYEEAAGQGLLAGVNAARHAARQAPVTIGRDQAYIGVLIDDLVTRSLVEPYRMFSSRAEHRLHLRFDNADTRLTPLGRQIGLVDDARWERFQARRGRLAGLHGVLGRLCWEGRPLREWLKRPEEDGLRFVRIFGQLADYYRERDVWTRALVEIKYGGYLERQRRVIDRFRSMEARRIPAQLDYAAIPQLRREAVERWSAVRPCSVGQASRVSGIRPTDVSMLLVHLARLDRQRGLEPKNGRDTSGALVGRPQPGYIAAE